MDIDKLIELLPLQFRKYLDCALQPIIETNGSSILGYECLLRGHDLVKCRTPLSVFKKAKEFDLLLELELLVRRNAIEKFSKLNGTHEMVLFFNFHCGLLPETDLLLSCTEELLVQYDLSPANICFEIPEYDSRVGEALFFESLQKVRQAGYSIALDDFGAGFSQIKALYDLPVDYIKIDRFLVSDINNDSKKRLMMTSLIDLAHVLGIRVIAKGVEKKEEYFTCCRLGCDLGQGFLIAHPETSLRAISSLDFKWNEEGETKRNGGNDFLRDLVIQEVIELTAIPERALMKDVLDIFKGSHQRIIPVINSLGKPLGLIHESAVISYLYMPFGQDLLANKTHKNRLRDFMKNCPSRDINAPIERIIDLKSDTLSDGLIVTKNGRYYGVLRPTSLVKISNEMRVQAAEDKNPLTKLPGNLAISNYVEEERQQSHCCRHLCYLDFDFFKPFNDTYGFRLGDRAIQMFSEILRRHLTIDNAFLGHVGGDDFFVGLSGYGHGRVFHIMEKIRTDFSNEVESLYDANHRQQGYIVGEDRSGTIQKFPLLTCSIAIIELSEGYKAQSNEQISQIIAAAKHAAKISESGFSCQKLIDENEVPLIRSVDLDKLAG